MIPKEIEITDKIDGYIAKGSPIILVHPRDPEKMLAAIKKLENIADMHYITLGAHVQDDKDRDTVRRVFADYLHLVNLIIWNDLSRPGYCSEVRWCMYEVALELFELWFFMIDCDLNNKSKAFYEKNGELKRHPIDGEELLKWAHWGLEKQAKEKQKRFIVGFKDNDDNLHRTTWRYGVPILGGFYAVNTVLARAYRKRYPGWNPWTKAVGAGMVRVEDIAAGHFAALEHDKMARMDFVSWDGCRINYYRQNMSFLTDHIKCALITSTEYMNKFSQKLWKIGPLALTKPFIKGIKFDEDVSNPNDIDSDALSVIVDTIAVSDDFCNLYMGACNAKT